MKRYEPEYLTGVMAEDSIGEWVRYDDVQAELTQLREQLATEQTRVEVCRESRDEAWEQAKVPVQKQMAKLRAELTQLRAENLLLAKLGCGKPMFFNPLEAWEAKALAERIVEGGAS